MTASVQNQLSHPRQSARIVWLLVGLALIVGAFVRFASVEGMSFYGDEETTAFAARSVIESGRPMMPSGMDYNRAPLYSYMAAASASVFGLDAEFGYRLPALVFGVIAILALFIGTRSFFGTPIALVCAFLLATSEWHVITSGYARMYSPYLALFIVTAFAFLEWQRHRRVAALWFAILVFFLTASFQILAVFAAGLLLLPYMVAREIDNRRLLQDTVVTIAITAVVILLDAKLVQSAYSSFAVAVDGDHKSTVLTNVDTFWIPLALQLTSGWPLLITCIGGAAIGGLVWLWRYHPWPFLIGFAGLGLLSVCMLALGQLYSLTVALYLTIVLFRCHDFRWMVKLAYALPLIMLALAVAALDNSIGFRALLVDPNEQFAFPYLAFFFVKYPILVGLALVAPFLPLPAERSSELQGAATLPSTLTLFFVFNLLLFGLLGQWYEDRYIAHAYPFAIITAAYSFVWLVSWLLNLLPKVNRVAFGLGMLLLACLLMPHHLALGIHHSLAREHGSRNIENGRYFPDHASVGKFVRERLQPGDTIVATDVLQQRWYVGQADYWLRSVSDVNSYIYQLPNREVRDVYVHSRHVDSGIIEQLLASKTRTWVIASSVDMADDWAFSALENDYLAHAARRGKLMFTGRDGQAKVFLLQAAD